MANWPYNCSIGPLFIDHRGRNRKRLSRRNRMSASPSHPVAAPVDLQAGAVPKVLNLAEAAAFVRCSRAHLCNVIHHKVPGVPHLPSVRIGRRVLFRRESLEQWLEEVEAGVPKSAAR